MYQFLASILENFSCFSCCNSEDGNEDVYISFDQIYANKE